MTGHGKIKILIADNDGGLALRMKHFLEDKGFIVSRAKTGAELRAALHDFQPRFVLIDLVLNDMSAFELLDYIRTYPQLAAVQVLVTSNHNDELNIQQAMVRGARDWLVKPFQFEDLLKRIVFHARSLRMLHEPNHKEVRHMDNANLMLHLAQLLMREALSIHPLELKLQNLTRMLNSKVSGVRCSIVEAMSRDVGVVVTSNDDKNATGLELNLNNYPEILHVIAHQKLVVIENMHESEELKPILAKLQQIQFNSLITAPLQRQGKPFGVLSVRIPPEKKSLDDEEVRFVDIVAGIASLLLTSEYGSIDFWQQNRRPTMGQVISFAKKR